MSVGPYAEFNWRAFGAFYACVAVILGGAGFVARGLIAARPLPWTPRVVGPTDFVRPASRSARLTGQLLKEHADTGAMDDDE